MKKLIFLLILSFALPALAKRREPIPVYIEKPPLSRSRLMSIPDRNRLYAERNPITKVSDAAKEYLKLKAAEAEKIKEEDMPWNKEPTPANNRPLRGRGKQSNVSGETGVIFDGG